VHASPRRARRAGVHPGRSTRDDRPANISPRTPIREHQSGKINPRKSVLEHQSANINPRTSSREGRLKPKVCQWGKRTRPVEPRPRVGLSARGDVAVAADVAQRQSIAQGPDQHRKALILRPGEVVPAITFEFDPHGEIVACRAAEKRRLPCVPGAPVDINELDQGSSAPQKEVGRHPQTRERSKARMGAAVESTHEEAFNRIAAEAPRRKADMVQHHETHFNRIGPGIGVRRDANAQSGNPAAPACGITVAGCGQHTLAHASVHSRSRIRLRTGLRMRFVTVPMATTLERKGPTRPGAAIGTRHECLRRRRDLLRRARGLRGALR